MIQAIKNWVGRIKDSYNLHKKAQMGKVVGVGLGAFTMIVMLVLIDELISNTTFNSSLAETVKDYVVPLGFIVVIALIALALASRRRRR